MVSSWSLQLAAFPAAMASPIPNNATPFHLANQNNHICLNLELFFLIGRSSIPSCLPPGSRHGVMMGSAYFLRLHAETTSCSLFSRSLAWPQRFLRSLRSTFAQVLFRNELATGRPVHRNPQHLTCGDVRDLVLTMQSFMNSAPSNTLLIARKKLMFQWKQELAAAKPSRLV